MSYESWVICLCVFLRIMKELGQRMLSAMEVGHLGWLTKLTKWLKADISDMMFLCFFNISRWNQKTTGMRELMLYEWQSHVFGMFLTFRCLQPNYRCFRLATLPGCWKRLVLRIMESWCTRARITSLLTEARWNLVDSGCECHDAGYAVGHVGYSDIL